MKSPSRAAMLLIVSGLMVSVARDADPAPQPAEAVKYSMVFDVINPANGNVARTLLLETIFDGDRAYMMYPAGLGAWFDLTNQTMTQAGKATYTLESSKK